eukprot:scaffold4416_cov63-Attheya_sp.AAC.1
MQFHITSLLLAAAVALSANAFAPMSIAINRSSSFGISLKASDKPLAELCEITKEACDVVSPLLKEMYSHIKIGTGTSNTTAFKSDATFFTIIDGIIQHMFIEYLFAGDKFFEIVREEDESVVNIIETPYTVHDLVVPEEFEELIQNTLMEVKALIFVDPINGTRECAMGKGDNKVTILVGYNDREGIPQAGIIYRPLTVPATWASGAKSEDFKDSVLDSPEEPNLKGVLITDGKVSPFIASTIENLGMNKVPSLASGNHVLMLVEGKAGAYICADTGGFAKWDTSGPQEVLEVYGGVMAKLSAFLEDKSMISHTHLKSKLNMDFCKHSVGLTLSNARDKSMFIPGLDSIVTDVHLIKEYSCVQ